MNKLIDLNDAPCSVCKAEFLKTDLDEVGRCKVCAERNLQPGFKTEQEFVQKDTLSKDKIKEIIKEVLAELRAEESEADDLSEDGVTYKSKKCVKCGKDFVPRAPAAKVCDDCREAVK